MFSCLYGHNFELILYGKFSILVDSKVAVCPILLIEVQCRRPTWARIGYRMEPARFLLAEPSHSWLGCNMHSQLEGSCSTCKNKEHRATA